MEHEIPGLIASHLVIFREGSHKYSNVLEKVRNSRVGSQVAWLEFQPVLEFCVEGYPEGFLALQPTIREIFDIRREAFFYEGMRKRASDNIRKILSSLAGEEQDLLTAPVVCIRDLFELTKPGRKPRI